MVMVTVVPIRLALPMSPLEGVNEYITSGMHDEKHVAGSD